MLTFMLAIVPNMNQLNSQFKSISLKFNASVYSNRISLAYTCHDAGFDTEFL